ncbi:MAG: AAA family ATPase [Clostridiales bacterium]|nr:AAA family ATPase [Clostridiales bacterium]
MYLSKLKLKNFRCFCDSHEIELNKGLNVLVGENDSGKSAIIDAIRIVMGTTDQGWYRIESTDFYEERKDSEISITLKFSDLSCSEQASFLECLSNEIVDGKQEPCLYINWKCKYLLNFCPPRLSVNMTTGVNGDGPSLPIEARELLRVTYLRPLRDSYSNMHSGRNSRLSQIIQGISGIGEGISDYFAGVSLEELSISGIASLSNYLLANHPKLKQANKEISSIMNEKMLLKGDSVSTAFSVAGNDTSDNKRLVAMLEKLDLIAHNNGMAGKIGLGSSNILSMACELLLNRDSGSSFLLIEEPEAHVHAQRQLRLIQSLQEEAALGNNNHQIILTTHSPLMASVIRLGNISIVKSKRVYSLREGKTKLEADDYVFLERYLDATKANLFFAKAVMMVEGPSEELLIPTIAKILKKDFTEYGISVVNVRGTGMRRFSRIFQRVDETEKLDIKVACVTDRDIMPDCAPAICIDEKYSDIQKWPEKSNRNWRAEADLETQEEKADYLNRIRERADGQSVKTYIAEHWTFEYDLAYAGFYEELIDAIVEVHYVKRNRARKKEDILNKYCSLKTKEQKAAYLYSFFSQKGISKAEVAQQLSFIFEKKYTEKSYELRKMFPKYIIDAIDYLI